MIIRILAALAGLYLLILIGRMILDWILVFARQWRPRGLALVIAETLYSLTDPPLRALRRIIPPLSLGPRLRIDVAFMVLFFGVWVLATFLRAFQ